MDVGALRNDILRDVRTRVEEALKICHQLNRELIQSVVDSTVAAVESSMGDILSIAEPQRRETNLTDYSLSSASTLSLGPGDFRQELPIFQPDTSTAAPISQQGSSWTEFLTSYGTEDSPELPVHSAQTSFQRSHSASTVRKDEIRDSQSTNDTGTADYSGSSTTSPADEESQKTDEYPSTPVDRGDASSIQTELLLLRYAAPRSSGRTSSQE